MSEYEQQEEPAPKPKAWERAYVFAINTVLILVCGWSVIVFAREIVEILTDTTKRSLLIQHGTLPTLVFVASISLMLMFRNRMRTIVHRGTRFTVIGIVACVVFLSWTFLENAISIAHQSQTRGFTERILASIFMGIFAGASSVLDVSKSNKAAPPS